MSKTTTAKEMTMAELMAKYDVKIKSFSTGQKIKAKVVAKTQLALILDVGGKSEGIVTEKAFVEARDLIRDLKVGDEVTATVLIPETRDGTVLLSLRQAAYDAIWEKMEKAFKEGKEVAVYGKGANNSGVTVDVEGLLGFIPTSQLGKEISGDTEELIGKYFKAIPVEVDKLNNKLVLSEKEVSEAEDIKKNKEIMKSIKEGEIFEGIVTTVANFGCFVKINVKGSDIEGLVHISELSWGKVPTTADVVKEGDKVKVKVIGERGGKLSLSMKQAGKDPWTEVSNKYPQEMQVKGKVTKISDFGVFVQVEPGVEGLIHVTSIPPTKKFNVDDEVECYVQEIDSKNKKMSLGLVLTEKPIGYK